MSVSSVGKALIFSNVTVISNAAEGIEQGAAAAAKAANDIARGRRKPDPTLPKDNKPLPTSDRNPGDVYAPSKQP